MQFLGHCCGCVIILLKKLPYKQLAALGLVVYQPRTTAQVIIPEHIRINARCLVLLYSAQFPANLDPQEQKILQGMIGVLDLQPQETMRATIYGSDLQGVAEEISSWQPKFILQLSMELPHFLGQNCIQTYSPSYLKHNPQFKAEAYKSLLALQSKIHGK